MLGLPPVLVYVVIGAGAAVENIFPPVPADTFVLIGAFLSVSGRVDPVAVFLVTWFFNVASAVFVYAVAHKYGRGVFRTRVGHWLLKPKQLEDISTFYERWGPLAIFMSRFLPGFRAVVPVFAGVTHVPLSRTLPPLAVASGLWYGALVYLGYMAGSNWRAIMSFFSGFSTVALVLALMLGVLIAVWWKRSRRDHP